MKEAAFILSAFGDEIADDLSEQLTTLNDLNIGYLDLRNAWGTNVLHMDDDDVTRVIKVCDTHAVKIGCLGSPIGKSPILEPIEFELGNLEKIIKVCNAV